MAHGNGEKKKGVLKSIKERNIAFFFSFLFVFVFTLVILTMLDAVPVPRAAEIGNMVETLESGGTSQALVEDPVHIKAATVGMDAKVLNPTSSDISVLDEALLRGAVRYPGSARLGQSGNVLIFGHSSYLSTVFNQNYKAFNNIQNLKTGETIVVSSEGRAYEYEVVSVKFVKADDYVVDLTANGKRLTLVTCNSFATKSDRFVVEANFVRSYQI